MRLRSTNPRGRFWAEVCAAWISLGVGVATIANTEWIEMVFGVDPDAGSGSMEWAVALTSLLTTGFLAVAARLEWKRSLAAA
jgi:hypothetical protein